MSSRHLVTAVAAVAGGIVADEAAGAVVTSHPHDFEASFVNGTTYAAREGGTEGDELRVGGQSGIKMTGVYYFQLPELPAGQQVLSANFATSSLADDSSGGTAPGHNADLWGLGIDNNNFPGPISYEIPDTTTADLAAQAYYHDNDVLGSHDGESPNGNVFRQNLKIMDNFLTPADWVANGGAAITKETSTDADVALVAYLNAIYANPNFVPDSSYVIFRVNPDLGPDTTATRRYNISSAGTATGENPTADAGAILPTLTFDTGVVPEPGAAALAGLAGLAALFKRRR